jgi:hypothetical protein
LTIEEMKLRGNLGATGKVVVIGHGFKSWKQPLDRSRVQVLETASCVKQGKAAYNIPNGGTLSRTLHMREL